MNRCVTKWSPSITLNRVNIADRPDALKAITQRFTASLESIVRQYPDQYFWLHRRWKHQPPVRKAKAA